MFWGAQTSAIRTFENGLPIEVVIAPTASFDISRYIWILGHVGKPKILDLFLFLEAMTLSTHCLHSSDTAGPFPNPHPC